MEENLLTQAEKTPKPLSHPYTRATQSHVSVGLTTIVVDGQGLNLCFDLWRGEGIFWTRAKIRSPRESNPEPLECYLELQPLSCKPFHTNWKSIV
jgi:hypothetical protein